MDGTTQIVIALISTAGLVASAYAGAIVQTRRMASRSSVGVATKWRDQYELADARAELMEEQRDDEHRTRLAVEGQLAADHLAWKQRETELMDKIAATEHDLDTCSRQLDDARSELRGMADRGVQRRRAPRRLA